MDGVTNDEMKALMTPAKMSEAEIELRKWIADCKHILEGRNAQEVAAMAIRCGFDRGLVYEVLVHFRDAWDGTHVNQRAAFMIVNTMHALWDFNRLKADLLKPEPIDFMPLWKRAHEYQTGEAA